MPEIKCTCGSWLELRAGKFGSYFNCLNCGNVNYNKGMAMKELTMKDMPKVVKEEPKVSLESKVTPVRKEPERKKEITISTDDVEYFS